MKQQDRKPLTKVAIDRAVTFREAPGVQLTRERIEQVCGGLDASSKDACKMTVWEKRYTQVELEDTLVTFAGGLPRV